MNVEFDTERYDYQKQQKIAMLYENSISERCVEKFGKGWTEKGYPAGGSKPDCVEINGQGYGYL